MRACTKCKAVKDQSDFNTRGLSKKTGRRRISSWCKECLNRHNREKRRNSPEARAKNRTSIKAARNRLIEEVNVMKREPCSDCGNTHNPWVMQFDHVRGKKVGNVGNLVHKGQRFKALAEIKKCELVCANCHAERTYVRRRLRMGRIVASANLVMGVAHRVLMENKLGRVLRPDELVHHKDEDKTNDEISNLEVKTRAEHSRDHAKRVELVDCSCAICGSTFQLKPHQKRLREKRTKTGELHCSRSCGGKASHR